MTSSELTGDHSFNEQLTMDNYQLFIINYQLIGDRCFDGREKGRSVFLFRSGVKLLKQIF